MNNKIKIYALILLATSALASPALAQEATLPAENPVQDAQAGTSGQEATAQGAPQATPSTQEAGSQAGDIVVTARRRAERLQDVPISMTALSGDALTQQQVTSAIDLSRSTPSLQIARNVSGGESITVRLRGIGGNEALLGQDQTIGFYVDEVPFARQEGLNGLLFDMGSVQVLYGPQGTLFGRNSVAGAVVYSSQRPTTDAFAGSVNAELGNYDRRYITGFLNVPLTNTLAVRVAGQIRRRDGWLREVNSGVGLGSEHANGWRVSIQWQPTSALTNDLIVGGLDARNRNTGGATFGTKAFTVPACTFNPANPSASLGQAACYYGPGAPVPAYLASIGSIPASAVAAYASYPTTAQAVALNNSLPNDRIALARIPRSINRNVSVTDIANLQLGSEIALKVIGGYRHSVYRYLSEGEGFADPAIAIPGGTVSDQYSGEVQLQGKTLSGQLQYTGGAFYFYEDGENFTGNRTFGYSDAQPYASMSVGEAKNRSYSGYAQTTFRPDGLNRFSLTTGFRYTWDRRELALTSGARLPGPDLTLGTQTGCSLRSNSGASLPLSACRLSNVANYKVPTFLATADYKLSGDVLVYATYSRGYRSGGFNVRSLFTPRAFGPEKADNMEGGIKAGWSMAGIPVRLNFDYWHLKYRDVQATALVSVPGTSPVIIQTDIANANSLKLHGVEVDGSIEPMRGVSLRGFLGLVKGTYDRLVQGGITYTDKEYDAPKVTWGLNLTASQDIEGAGTLSFAANYSFTGGALNTLDPTAPQVRNPSVKLANFRVGLADVAGTGLQLGIFARNVGDSLKRIPVYGINPLTRGQAYNITEPTYYGAEIGFRY
jgi:iron complex outermembrane receptor protein